MIITPLLEEKERVQKELAREAQYDIRKYMENANKAVLEIQEKYGLKLKYGNIKGGKLKLTP